MDGAHAHLPHIHEQQQSPPSPWPHSFGSGRDPRPRTHRWVAMLSPIHPQLQLRNTHPLTSFTSADWTARGPQAHRAPKNPKMWALKQAWDAQERIID